MRRINVFLSVIAAGAAIASCNLALGLGDYDSTSGSGASHGSGTMGSTGTTGTTGSGGTGGGESNRGTAIWSKGFGNSQTQTVAAIAVDGSGAVYVTGSFQGVLSLNGQCSNGLSAQSTTTTGYLIKFDSTGTCMWAIPFGATGVTVAGTAITVSSGGEITLAGTYTGNGFGVPNSVSLQPPADSGLDTFVVRYPAAFDPTISSAVWLQQFGGGGDQVITGLALDGGGNVYAVGWYTGVLQIFKATTMETQLTGASTKAGFAVQLASSDGAPSVKNAVSNTGTGDVAIKDVAFDAGGGIVAVGGTTGGLNYGTGPVSGNGGMDAFVLKYDISLAGQGNAVLGDTSAQDARSVTFGLASGLYVAGAFQGAIDFKNGVKLTAGVSTAFLASVDPQGKGLAAIPLGTLDLSSPQTNVRLAAASKGDIIFAGSMQGMLSVGGLKASTQGKNDAVVGRLDSTLKTAAWLHAYGDTMDQGIDAVAVDQDDNIIVAGHFQGKLDLGNGNALPSSGSGGTDIFVAKLGH